MRIPIAWSISVPRVDKASFSSTSWLNYRDIHTQSTLLQDAAGYTEDVSVLETPDGSQSILAPHVTTNLFPMLGARPLLGRTFIDAEGQTGGPLAVVLSEGLWRQSFHADPGIVGQGVKISGKTHTVVGVMPHSFHFPEQVGADLQKGVWVPLQPTAAMLKDRGYNFFNVVGELRSGGHDRAGCSTNSMRLPLTFPEKAPTQKSNFAPPRTRNYSRDRCAPFSMLFSAHWRWSC